VINRASKRHREPGTPKNILVWARNRAVVITQWVQPLSNDSMRDFMLEILPDDNASRT
jgi:hypothetical protein